MRGEGWQVEWHEGFELLRCELLEVPGVRHAFFTARTRPPRGSSRDPAPAAWQDELRAVGLAGCRPILLRQVHGRRVVRAEHRPSDVRPQADGAIALREHEPEIALGVSSADCVPLLLAAASGRLLAAVHAGWRGTALGIVRHAVQRIRDCGIRPEDLRAALGPAIGACCYEVGDEVLTAVSGGTKVDGSQLAGCSSAGRQSLDLAAANQLQLLQSGVPQAAISRAPWCTACEATRFHSYRRNGPAAGRMTGWIGWAGSAGAPSARDAP